MSYCRFSEDSGVYVYEGYGVGDAGVIVCCGCRIEGHFETDDGITFLRHLAEHRTAGHKVPDDVSVAILEEMNAGDWLHD